MIPRISRVIADFFVQENVIEEEEAEVYQYGLELCVSSLISVLLTLIISLCFGMIVESLIFYIVFCVTRLFSGGYHADSYFMCKVVFAASLIMVLIFNIFTQRVSVYFWLGFWLFYFLTIAFLAPVDNPNKKLDEDENTKHRNTSFVLAGSWFLLWIIVQILHDGFARIIPLTLTLVSVLMILAKGKEIINKGGKQNAKCEEECT